eukprot:GHUV01020009.1.p1 GENE.GHUV01020009.1~~GHUV01020009.1.p1  ORF type:complete len:213 (+),score=68.35 GHUV01020009.1:872-1510(+)
MWLAAFLLQHPTPNGYAANSNSSTLPVSQSASAPFEITPAGAGSRNNSRSQRQPPQQLDSGTFGPSAAASTTSSSKPNFESLDYELVENTVYRTDTASQTHLDHIFKSGVKWTLCFALGGLTDTPHLALQVIALVKVGFPLNYCYCFRRAVACCVASSVAAGLGGSAALAVQQSGTGIQQHIVQSRSLQLSDCRDGVTTAINAALGATVCML